MGALLALVNFCFYKWLGSSNIGIPELSGEIKDIWQVSCPELCIIRFSYLGQDKRVTIVHGHSLPLNDTYPDRWRKAVAKKSEKRGVQLVLGDYITNLETQDGRVVTRSGKSIPADLVVCWLFRVCVATILISPF